MDWHMSDEQVRAWANGMLERLGTSKFRASFALCAKDRSYALDKGEDVIRRHAHDLLAKRVGTAWPEHDGRQTPWRGHPVFTAQHATATCCRGCIEKWHHIPKGRPLTDDELADLTELVVRWIRRDLVRQARREGRQVPGGRMAATPSLAGTAVHVPGEAGRQDLDQHFLRSPEKIARIVEAAGIGPADEVAELGAGIGSVAERLPQAAGLTLVELDHDLCDRLRRKFAGRPEVRVVEGDAVAFLASEAGRAQDVVISNLPSDLTPAVLDALVSLPCRVALVAVRRGEDLGRWRDALAIEPVEVLASGDFEPAQPYDSEVVRVTPRVGA